MRRVYRSLPIDDIREQASWERVRGQSRFYLGNGGDQPWIHIAPNGSSGSATSCALWKALARLSGLVNSARLSNFSTAGRQKFGRAHRGK